MKLALKDLVLCWTSLQELYEKKGLKASVAYRIKKDYDLIEKEMKPYTDVEQEIFKKYAIKDENGEYKSTDDGKYIFNVSDFQTIQGELDKIQAEEVDLAIKTISFDDLEDSGLSGAQIAALEFMLEFDDSDEKVN